MSLRLRVIARSEATKQSSEAKQSPSLRLRVIARSEAKQSNAMRRRLGLASMLTQRRLRPTCDTRRWIASLLD
jgi:hypothetical protein